MPHPRRGELRGQSEGKRQDQLDLHFRIKRDLEGLGKYSMQTTKRREEALEESMMHRKDGTPRYSRGSLTEIAEVLWESLVEPAKIRLIDRKRREEIRDKNIGQLVRELRRPSAPSR